MVETIADLFYEALRHNLPNALVRLRAGRTSPLSHLELQRHVEHLALALAQQGLVPGDAVAILAENRPEWAIVDYACAISGLPTVPIYPTLNNLQAAYILADSRAKWIFCANRSHLDQVLEAWPGLPHLQRAILMEGELPEAPGRTLLSWSELLQAGQNHPNPLSSVRAWARQRKPDDLLTLIYTSGTTGAPKGAMLTHGNLVSNILLCLKILQPREGERCLSILPLSHVYERMAGHYAMLHCGVSIHYAESLQTLGSDLRTVRPHLILGVPRIYEKVYVRVRDAALAGGLFKRAILGWSLHLGRKISRLRCRSQALPLWLRLKAYLADILVFRSIRNALGGRIRMAISGGAPLSPKVHAFFWGMGVPIFEGYGLTETSPIIALNRPGQIAPGCVGHPLLETWNRKPFLKFGEDGEILCQGPGVMKGYWNHETATREAMDPEGYFRTGDIGELDTAGRLRITDRKKEILVTSAGKNVAPQPIEQLLTQDKYIEQAVLAGNQRHFIAALIVPHMPTLRLWARRQHLVFQHDGELARLPEVQAKLMRRVERINERLSNFERVKKILILDQEMTVESGLLTPSLKIRRQVVAEVFRDRIQALYDPASSSS